MRKWVGESRTVEPVTANDLLARTGGDLSDDGRTSGDEIDDGGSASMTAGSASMTASITSASRPGCWPISTTPG